MRGVQVIKKKNIRLMGIDKVSPSIIKSSLNLCETKFAADIHTFKAKKQEEERLTTKEKVIRELFGVEL